MTGKTLYTTENGYSPFMGARAKKKKSRYDDKPNAK